MVYNKNNINEDNNRKTIMNVNGEVSAKGDMESVHPTGREKDGMKNI